jgi:diguanylate cyclase (GGDEF)-like protein
MTASVRDWPLWSLPRWSRAYVIGVQAVAAAGLGLAAVRTQWHLPQLGIFLLLLCCAGAMVEATRDVKLPPTALTRDLQEVWYLSIALLLPPVYGMLIPVPLVAMKHWRVRRNLVHRRVFSVAAVGLAYGAASAEYHAVSALLAHGAQADGAAAFARLGAIALAAATGSLINDWLVAGAVKLADPSSRTRAMMFSREAVVTQLVATCLAALVGFALTFSLAVVVLAVPVVLMQKRVLMHAQLVAEARTDAKTGLLNAAAWQGQSATELARAKNDWLAASVAIIDIDHFKAVNDTHGHLAGDQVLRVIADRFKAQLRDGDLIGRFGGEEFAVLLPRTSAVEAERVAERLRARIADEPVVVGDGRSEGVLVNVTVSVGVAGLEDASQDLDELLAAADAALYAAKNAGRNRICVGVPELARTGMPASRDPGPAVGSPQ